MQILDQIATLFKNNSKILPKTGAGNGRHGRSKIPEWYRTAPAAYRYRFHLCDTPRTIDKSMAYSIVINTFTVPELVSTLNIPLYQKRYSLNLFQNHPNKIDIHQKLQHSSFICLMIRHTISFNDVLFARISVNHCPTSFIQFIGFDVQCGECLLVCVKVCVCVGEKCICYFVCL